MRRLAHGSPENDKRKISTAFIEHFVIFNNSYAEREVAIRRQNMGYTTNGCDRDRLHAI